VDWENKTAEMEGYLETMRQIAHDAGVADKAKFVLGDHKLFKPDLEYLGLNKLAKPYFILQPGPDFRYRPTSPASFTTKGATSFLKDFFNNKLQPFITSEPDPETNDAPVKKVTGKNFYSIVKDREKDVLLLVYNGASW
jgi:hypothetical protein